jgi:hypothetical protein
MGAPDAETFSSSTTYRGFQNWDEVSLERYRRGELTFGSVKNPIPTASAPAFTPEKPGIYHIGTDRHTLLTDQEKAAEQAAREAYVASQAEMPGLSDIEEEYGYLQPNLPAYLSQIDVPDESYYFVPDDYTAYWEDNYGNGIWREPRYKSSDNQAYFSLRTFSPEYLAIFQDQMVDAHLLRKGSYLPGMKDQATLAALETTMGVANMTGEWYKKIAGDMAAAGRTFRAGGGYVRPPFVKRTYVKPDYEELSFASKESFRKRLGRDPHDWEMKLIADKLGGEHQRQFDVVEEARWKDYQRGTGGNKLTSETIEGLESPVDVTLNYMDRKWAPEFDRKERVEAERRGAQRFFGSMMQTDARIFSGRSGGTTQQVANP